jgi:hypothetical protein
MVALDFSSFGCMMQVRVTKVEGDASMSGIDLGPTSFLLGVAPAMGDTSQWSEVGVDDGWSPDDLGSDATLVGGLGELEEIESDVDRPSCPPGCREEATSAICALCGPGVVRSTVFVDPLT